MSSTLNISQLEYIGTGIQWPNPFDLTTGGVQTNSGEPRINQSIYLILSTPVGTRLFNPEFGSNLNHALFDNELDTDLIIYYVTDALSKWEKRINVQKVSVTPDPTVDYLLNISITYTVINTNVAGNYVYPLFSKPFLYGYGSVQQNG